MTEKIRPFSKRIFRFRFFSAAQRQSFSGHLKRFTLLVILSLRKHKWKSFNAVVIRVICIVLLHAAEKDWLAPSRREKYFFFFQSCSCKREEKSNRIITNYCYGTCDFRTRYDRVECFYSYLIGSRRIHDEKSEKFYDFPYCIQENAITIKMTGNGKWKNEMIAKPYSKSRIK